MQDKKATTTSLLDIDTHDEDFKEYHAPPISLGKACAWFHNHVRTEYCKLCGIRFEDGSYVGISWSHEKKRISMKYIGKDAPHVPTPT